MYCQKVVNMFKSLDVKALKNNIESRETLSMLNEQHKFVCFKCLNATHWIIKK